MKGIANGAQAEQSVNEAQMYGVIPQDVDHDEGTDSDEGVGQHHGPFPVPTVDEHPGKGPDEGLGQHAGYGSVGEDLGRLVFQTEPDNNGKLYGVAAKHGQELPDPNVQVGLQPFIVFHEGGLKK